MTVYRRSWKLKSGKTRSCWVAETFVSGKRFRRHFASAAEAEIAQKTFKNPTQYNAKPLLFREVGESYIQEQRVRGLEKSTYTAYSRHLSRHINPRIGDVDIADIDRETSLNLAGICSKGLSRALAAAVFSTFQRVVKFAHDTGRIVANPIIGLQLNSVRGRHIGRRLERARVPTVGQIGELCRRIEWGDGSNNEFVRRADVVAALGIFCGLRASEIRGLRLDHIVKSNAGYYIRIRQRADLFGQIGPTKTRRSTRDVPLPKKVFDLLMAYAAHHDIAQSSLLLRSGVDGKPIDYSNFIGRDWRQFCLVCLAELSPEDDARAPDPIQDLIAYFLFFRKHAKPSISIHGLRHAYATLQIQKGVPPKLLQHRMGHSSVATTLDLYGHIFADQERDQADAEQHALEIDRIAALCSGSDDI